MASPQRVILPGHLIGALHGKRPLGSLSPTHPMQLSVQVPLRNTATLQTLLSDQDDQQSPLFHHYLTPDEFTSQFGPLPQTTNRAIAYLTGQGLHVAHVNANHAFITVSGTAAVVERAFDVTLDTYAFAGRTVYAPANEPSIPNTIAGTIQNIVGLDDVVVSPHRPLPTHQRATKQPPEEPTGCHPLGYGPYDLYTAYNIGNLAETSSFNGTGQTIDIVSFDGADEGDITPFDQCFGLPDPTFLSSVSVPNGSYSVNTTPATLTDAVEDDMDMEVAHEIAPGAALRYYFGSNQGTNTVADSVYFYVTDVLPVFEQIVQDDNGAGNPGSTSPPPIVTSSWLIGCEEDLTVYNSVTPSDMEQYDTTLTQGAAEGIPFFEGSGDFGSDDCFNKTKSIDISVADPHVVAVGGTQYTANSDNTRDTEVGWNGSGGGQSTYFPVPFYQQHLPAYYVTPTMRGVPDVSADAYTDFSTLGYTVYCAASSGSFSCPGWKVNGGTSAATPLWAGMAADIDSYLTSYGKYTLGTASSLLYQVNLHDYPNAFYDITSGSNGAYSAGPGYDFVTGMGSPNAWRIANDLYNEIERNIESDVVWGQTQSNGDIDLLMAYNRSDASGWSPAADVTKLINQIDDRSSNAYNLRAAGPPTVISFPTPTDGTEMDVFALVNDTNGTEELHGFSYLPASGAWSDLGTVASGSAALPNLNPVALIEHAPGQSPVLALYGISSASSSYDHLIQYYTFLGERESGNPPAWNFRDLTGQTGITCDHHIDPAAVLNGTPVVFAACGGKLVEFYDNGTGTYHANTGLSNIPNASEAFPGHSLAAMVIPGNPAAIDAFVANDRNGANVLSEELYDGSAWHSYTLPVVSGHVPDQVHAQTVVKTNLGGTSIVSEVIATDPASTSCFTKPASVQYLYQPNVSNPPPGWYSTVLNSTDELGITAMQAIVEQSGTVFTEAFTGAYTGSGTTGGEGGVGCTANNSLYEDGSALSPSSPQSWFANLLDDNDVDNAGVDPAGTEFPY